MIDTHDIAKKIKDGSYFSDSRRWYLSKYVFPITERSFLILISAVIIYMACILFFNLRGLLFENNERLFVTYTQDTSSKTSVLRELKVSKLSPQMAVIKRLVIDYLITREEFIPTKMNDKNYQRILKKIKSSSDKSVLNEYKTYMDRLNPYSPFIRYRTGITREIAIKDFKFLTEDLTTGKVLVTFEATETNPNGTHAISSWKALIHYRIPDIETIAQTGAPMRFIVKYYRIRLI